MSLHLLILLTPTYTLSPPHPSFPTAQERLNDLEVKMENMLATVDKVFKVEIMKMPPSLQNTLIGDLISGEPPPRHSQGRFFICL